ncbi:MAG: hypothetical protein ACRCZG_01420 [Culicoidibacterales bacterium]
MDKDKRKWGIVMEMLKKTAEFIGVMLVSTIIFTFMLIALDFDDRLDKYQYAQQLQFEAQAVELENDQLTIQPYKLEQEQEFKKITKELESKQVELEKLQKDVQKKQADLGVVN